MELELWVSGDGAQRTLSLEGSCDLAGAPRLRQTLHELLPPEVTELVIDVSALHFVDSTSLGVILGALRRLKEGGGTLRLTGATGPVLRVLEVTGLDKVLLLPAR